MAEPLGEPAHVTGQRMRLGSGLTDAREPGGAAAVALR
ncbi:hypothetical protein BSU04_15360 [Caballeronia sordidicola]|jgi:hypothetical protein|uniref:Uncharacterized protein n=1 Tax=Caballeronia sordidicola TaxID=196367 RepID=A0A226X411_CABSO|nr:hypothetical protein BSU04_15360 [Caballeronia sordidicola]